ncbi:MAG: DNA polymerase III subunit beta [Pyrinomonadaceae bacterium]
MQFVIARGALQKELAFVQGVVERKNTIPVLANILIESAGEDSIRISGTDLDVTIRCDADANEIKSEGAICVQARKLFDIARLLPDAPVSFRKEENEWVTVECDRSKFRLPGISKETFPELPGFKSTPLKLPASLLKLLIDRTIFAITQEEGRYTLSGAKFELDDKGIKMVTTDGHRLAYVATKNGGAANGELDVLIPRKTLAELTKLTADFDGDISLGADENHVYFQVGSRLLISRMLSGQFPNYEMVMPKNNDQSATFDTTSLNQAIRRVALMADDRSHAIRFHLSKEQLLISSQNAEEGEARETIETDFTGEDTDIGFNAQYLQDFLNVVGSEKVAFEFKDGNSQAQLKPVSDDNHDYKYIVMPMRL